MASKPPKKNPVERLAGLRGIVRKPPRRPFTWVFDEDTPVIRLIDGRYVQTVETRPVERVIMKSEILYGADGQPLMEEDQPALFESFTDKVSGRISHNKVRDATFVPKTIDVPVIEHVPCTWAEDLAAAGIKDGPEATAYMHTEAMDYVVAFPGEDGVHRFAARDEPHLHEMIREHLAGYPGLKARVAEWRAGRSVPSADIVEEARNANPELFSNTAPADPIDVAREINARLLHKDDDINPQAPSDWDMDGQGVVETMPAVSNVPPEIAALLDDGETLTRDVRRKLTERLNVELAELKNLRGLAGEDLKREAEIEKLLGLFARLGEI